LAFGEGKTRLPEQEGTRDINHGKGELFVRGKGTLFLSKEVLQQPTQKDFQTQQRKRENNFRCWCGILRESRGPERKR